MRTINACGLAICVLVAACGDRKAPGALDGSLHDRWPVRDGHLVTDSAIPGFCDGTVPLAELNGSPVVVSAIKGAPVVMDCCDGAELRFTFVENGQPRELVVMLRIEAVSSTAPPQTIDVSRPPAGWSVSVNYHPCSPPTSCSLMDTLSTMSQDTFQGSLSVLGESYTLRTLSVCLEATRATATSSPLQSARLFARDVPTF